MLRSICALFATLVCTTPAAFAASLAVSPDKLTYNVGETITLTVFADDEGATSYAIFGRLNYSGALVDNGTRSQTVLAGNLYGPWETGALLEGDDGVDAYSWAFNQLSGLYQQSALNLPGPLATVTLIAQAVGVVAVEWDTTNPDEIMRLDFFGLTSAPGTSFTIVPEPGTAALLGLGLLALTATRHNRERS